ncbi:type I addiction module toxin, SymE family [Pectobacterium aquaticum]|nr:type I addiction module toxin, SymE family [Pectobacterium aquaticum]
MHLVVSPYPATTKCRRSPPHRWWLEKLGFNTGQPAIITVERGRLVIETEPRF